MRNRTFLAAAATFLLMAGTAFAGPIVNGGFETGTFSGWTVNPNPPACSGVGASYNAATGCWGMDADPGPHSGSFAAYLGFNSNSGVGSIGQQFSTVAGENYNIDFWLALGAYGGVYTPNSFAVLWDGNPLATYANATPFGWTHFQYTVTATGATSALTFARVLSNPSFWVVDDVNVEAVPEPASMLLFGTGLVGLRAWRKRR
jgi:hypothetical protein